MADRDEVIVIIAKDGRMVVDVTHQDHAKCEKLSARMRAAYALMGVRLRPEGNDESAPAIPVPEWERVKGGG